MTRTTPRTPSRPRSWSWSGRPAGSGCGIRWAPGCIRWPIVLRRVPGRPPPVGDATNDARRIPRREARAPSPTTSWAVLHEEIDRLPERYRAPVVLCDLEGRTHEQAARHLGWPVGTVKSRLSRGRERLRDRLLRRGIAPDAGLIAVAPSAGGPMASIPTAWWIPRPAPRAISDGPVHCSRVRCLASPGSLRAMTMTRWLKTASVLLVAGVTASGVECTGPGGTRVPRPEQRRRPSRPRPPRSMK